MLQTILWPFSRCTLVMLALVPTTAVFGCERLIGWSAEHAAVTSVEAIPAADGVPTHCRVRGIIETSIGFELLLPDEWNGKFLMGGAGGFVGHLKNQAQNGLSAGPTPLARGYATASTDTGHSAPRLSATWALGDAIARENYAHRGVHLTAQTAKSIIAVYYGHPTQRSYFLGCSNGGREAMISAQRYPADFDGILAMATAFDLPATAAQFVRIQQAVYPDPKDLESPAITPENVDLLAGTVNRKCDALDGVTDGVIDDPRVCAFRVDDLPICEGKAASQCVTPKQRDAIETVLAVLTIDGKQVAPGFPVGGENDPSGWPTWITKQDPVVDVAAPNAQYGFGMQFFKYFIFRDANWDYAEYRFEHWDADTAALRGVLNATDPDLDAFRDRGGKLILAHGWADAGVPAQFSIDYYRRVEDRDRRAKDYARLFLLPGAAHCGGGPGPDRVDWVDTLEQWVELGRAPTTVRATKVDARGNVLRERPICAYPEAARFGGSGGPDPATSYACVAP